MSTARTDVEWWTAEARGKQAHDAVSAIVGRLRSQQSTRRDAYLRFARSYGGCEIGGLGARTYATRSFKGTTLAFNVIASACNTVQAKIAKNRPVPMFLTNGGDWAQQTRAKKLSRFVEGEFYRCGVYDNDPLVVLHACALGDGFVTVSYTHLRAHETP